jgi:hypothetical protein
MSKGPWTAASHAKHPRKTRTRGEHNAYHRDYRAARPDLQERELGYAPPPPERDCPPRPADGRCEYCHKVGARLVMDHNHKTGAFLAWCCYSCNSRNTDRVGDFGETPWRRPARDTQNRERMAHMINVDQKAKAYVLAMQTQGREPLSKGNFEEWCKHDPSLAERTLQTAIWARVPHHAQFDQTKMAD